MDWSRHLETGHRGAAPRRTQEGRPALKLVHSSTRKPSLPVVEFGSGWYHDEAISQSHEVASHRCI